MQLLDAGAGVGKQDDHVAAVAHGFDCKHAAFVRFHGINRVGYEIEKDLHELIPIATHTGKH